MRVLMTNIIALCDEGLYEELLRYVPTERRSFPAGRGFTLTCPMREIMQPRYLMMAKSGSTWNRCGV